VTLYTLLGGKYDVPLHEVQAGRGVTFKEACFQGASEACKGLIKGLLVSDPARRLTAAEVLRHPWMQGEVEGNVGRRPTLHQQRRLPWAVGRIGREHDGGLRARRASEISNADLDL